MTGLSAQPLITVVIPTWNRLPLVEEAVMSVIAQTYPHWELIVVDDGSTDGTRGRLEALGDERIRVLSLPHSGHRGVLRNRGAAAGSGALIAFLDSDDVWLPQKLERQVAALNASRAGWCYAAVEMMDIAGRPVPMAAGEFRALSGRIIRDLLNYEATAPLTTLVVRRTLFDDAGRFTEARPLLVHEDRELMLRLALNADAVAVPESLARMRDHPARTTRGFSDPYERSARVFEMFLQIGPPAELARLARRYRTRELVNAGRAKLAAGHFVGAARLFATTLMQGAELRQWGGALKRGLREWFAGRPAES